LVQRESECVSPLKHDVRGMRWRHTNPAEANSARPRRGQAKKLLQFAALFPFPIPRPASPRVRTWSFRYRGLLPYETSAFSKRRQPSMPQMRNALADTALTPKTSASPSICSHTFCELAELPVQRRLPRFDLGTDMQLGFVWTGQPVGRASGCVAMQVWPSRPRGLSMQRPGPRPNRVGQRRRRPFELEVLDGRRIENGWDSREAPTRKKIRSPAEPLAHSGSLCDAVSSRGGGNHRRFREGSRSDLSKTSG
jgi:hypothetical protein